MSDVSKTNEPARFLVWHRGPDDIHPADTWLKAVAIANQLNTEYEAWAESHARGGGVVTIQSWAIPYTADEYRLETGHDIDLSEENDDV